MAISLLNMSSEIGHKNRTVFAASNNKRIKSHHFSCLYVLHLTHRIIRHTIINDLFLENRNIMQDER